MLSYLKAVGVDVHMMTRGGKGQFRFLKDETARVYKEVIPRAACRELTNRIDNVICQRDNGRIWRDALGSDTRILQFEHDIPDLLSYFQIDHCINAIDAYLGTKTRSWLLMANKVVPKKGNVGSGGGFHRDSPFSHQVKCIWYLADVTEANGPFSYVAGTQRNLLSQRRKYPLGTSRFDSIPDKVETVTAPAGSLLVCDTRAVHGGRPISEGARYAVTLYTFAGEEGIERLYRNSGLGPAAITSRCVRSIKR